ncbi:MAG: ATP-dependent transcriptional regulator, partial [Pseudomonadota bacterium]|nr:ATP-dependent transcriptional regulator [Pseudomonadota bacterium]
MATAPLEQPSRASTEPATILPPMKTFTASRASVPQVSNTDLARDILDLAFQLESGRQLPRFTRFEGPITLRLTGQA